MYINGLLLCIALGGRSCKCGLKTINRPGGRFIYALTSFGQWSIIGQ